MTAEDLSFQKVCRAEDVPPGGTKFVCIDGKPVILANFDGSIHALRGICNHQHKPLEGARLWGNLLDCPWHHFQYDVRTGENHFPKNVYPKDIPRLQEQLKPLRRYAVEVRGGEIWVSLE
jgi:3-phenylpropionate/trans-cinnamate dioxygenase ferredoxin subunit